MLDLVQVFKPLACWVIVPQDAADDSRLLMRDLVLKEELIGLDGVLLVVTATYLLVECTHVLLRGGDTLHPLHWSAMRPNLLFNPSDQRVDSCLAVDHDPSMAQGVQDVEPLLLKWVERTTGPLHFYKHE